MKEEIKWITIWIFANTVIAIMSLLYLYLSNELPMYGTLVLSICSLLIVFPYIIWKYSQIKYVEKRTLLIQILND